MSNVKANNAAALKKLNGAAAHAVGAFDDATDALNIKLAAARKQAKALKAEREAEAARAQAALDELAALKAAQPNPDHAAADRLASALDDFMLDFQAPSWKRIMASAVLGLVISACAGWVIGWVVGHLVAAIVLLTGSAFLAWAVLFVGLLCSMLAGMVSGSKAFAYVASGTIDKHASSVVSKVKGWFTSKPVEEFSGAHKVGAA